MKESPIFKMLKKQGIISLGILLAAIVVRLVGGNLYNKTQNFYLSLTGQKLEGNDLAAIATAINTNLPIVKDSVMGLFGEEEKTESKQDDGTGGEKITVPANASVKAYVLDQKVSNPLNGIKINSDFGYRYSPIDGEFEFHNALDLDAELNDPVYSVMNGTVEEIGFSSSLGNYIIIKHDGGFFSRYAHLQKTLVNAGDKVKSGGKIALAGTTGKSTGPHLHLNIFRNGVYLDPNFLLKAAS